MIKYLLTSSPHPLFFREISFFFLIDLLFLKILVIATLESWLLGQEILCASQPSKSKVKSFFEMSTSRDQIIWLQGGPIISRCTLLGLIALKDTLFIINLKQLSAWIIPQKAFHLFLALRELFQDVDIKIYNFYKIRKERKFKI